MSVHTNDKLVSDRNVLIIGITTVLVGFVFVNLLIFYFPRDNKIVLNDLSIQPINQQTKNQVATTNQSIYNITKSIASGGIDIVYIDNSQKLNQDSGQNSNLFENILNSKALISDGSDSWLESKKSEITNRSLTVLDLSKSTKLTDKIAAINIGNSDQLSTSPDFERLDYSYLLDEGNLKTTITQVSDLLVQIDPSNKDIYIKNQIELTTKIINIDNQYSQILYCSQHPIITNAKNLSYLASKYNIELSVVSNLDLLAPTSDQIKYLRDFAKSKNTTSFFVDKKIPLVEYNSLRNSLGLEIYYISDYIYPDIADTLQKNLENLKKSQACD